MRRVRKICFTLTEINIKYILASRKAFKLAILHTFMTLDHIISKEVFELGLPMDVAESASHIGRRLARSGLMQQLVKETAWPHEKPKDVLAPTLIYAACRQDGVPMTTSILAKYISGGQSGSARPQDAILLNYGIIKDKLSGFNEKMPTAQDYVPLICRFAVNAAVEDNRRNIELWQIDSLQAKALEYLDMRSQKVPFLALYSLGYAAGAVYLAAVELGIPLTQQNIGDVTGIANNSVRSRCHALANELGIQPAGRSHQALTMSSRTIKKS